MNLQDEHDLVLLVEDDIIDIKNIKYSFKKHDISNTLVIAEDGVEALDLLYGENDTVKVSSLPKIILLDINMPKLNGFEFLRRLQKDPAFANIPVVIITTSNSLQDTNTAKSLNVAGYFIKPLNFEEFFPLYKHFIEA